MHGYIHTHSSFDLRYIFLPQKTPLHYAAENGKINVVTRLLQQGAQVDGRVDGMWSGLFTTKMVNQDLFWGKWRMLKCGNQSIKWKYRNNNKNSAL